MAMDGRAEIRVGVKLASTKADLKKQLQDLGKDLTVKIRASKGNTKEIDKLHSEALKINKDYNRQIEQMANKREQSEMNRRSREKSEIINQNKAINAEYIRASKERERVLTEEAKVRMALNKAMKPTSQVQQTKTVDAINSMFITSKVKAKQSAEVWINEFNRIGTEIKQTKTIDAINNMYTASKKNAKQSAEVWKQSFKEIEQAASKAMANNNKFNQWFMPQASKGLPTASTSAFNVTQGEMSDRNKAFNQWFIPRSTTENINSAQASMSAFNTELSRGATIYDRYGNVNRQVTASFRNMNREMINATRNQFGFATMLGQGIKKMLIWSNMVIMEFILNNKYNYAPYIE